MKPGRFADKLIRRLRDGTGRADAVAVLLTAFETRARPDDAVDLAVAAIRPIIADRDALARSVAALVYTAKIAAMLASTLDSFGISSHAVLQEVALLPTVDELRKGSRP